MFDYIFPEIQIFTNHSLKTIMRLSSSRREFESVISSESSPFVDSTVKLKKLFTKAEDEIIKRKVGEYGTKNWKIVASFLHERTPRQVRERWKNYLGPDIKNGEWTQEEDELLTELIYIYGTQWSKISKYFENRTDTNVKNRSALLKRKAKNNKKIVNGGSNTFRPKPNQQSVDSKGEIIKTKNISPAPSFIECNKKEQSSTIIEFWSWDTMLKSEDLTYY